MEHKSGQRRKLKKVLLICALGVAILLLPVTASWMVRYCYVEIAVHAFQSNPSQARADKLIDSLDRRSPTHGQAARILKLLLQPKVATRGAYAIGRKPAVSTLLPFHLHFGRTMTCRMDIFVDGQELPTPHFSDFISLGTGPHVLVSPAAPDKCGKFSMELRFHYVLTPPPEDWQPYPTSPVGQFLYDLQDRIAPRRWSTVSEKKPYQVNFSVPVDINVVPEAEAEQVQLLSSPELDDRMREALRPDLWSGDPFQLHMLARRLPANVVFDCFLELPDGTRIRRSWPENQHLTGYAGRDFEINLWPGEYRVNRSRVHEANLVFEPDPNYALDEPTIKSIWNGRLELPIRFPGVPEPNTGE
jgi:hypothetical protein